MEQENLFINEAEWLDNLKKNWKTAIEGDGAFCPCCGKWGKVYKQKLSQHLALCLRWIVINEATDGWVDVQNKAPRWMLKSKTYPLLAHWKLIESQGKRSGVWRATLDGKLFANGMATAPASVYIYDNGIWGFGDEEVSFRGCFDRHFDFDEMMSERFDWTKLKEKRDGKGND